MKKYLLILTAFSIAHAAKDDLQKEKADMKYLVSMSNKHKKAWFEHTQKKMAEKYELLTKQHDEKAEHNLRIIDTVSKDGCITAQEMRLLVDEALALEEQHKKDFHSFEEKHAKATHKLAAQHQEELEHFKQSIHKK